MDRNSAGRLLALLRRLKFDNPLYLTVPKAFGGPTPADPGAQIILGFRSIRELQEVYEEFVQDMEELYPVKKQTASILAGLRSLEKFIYTPNISTIGQALDESLFALLDVCAKGLPVENEVSEDEFKELRESLAELRAMADRVKPALRKVLLELFRLADDAILKYQVRGAAGLNKALKQMWGELAEIWRITPEDSQEQSEKESAITAVKAFILRFDAAVAKAVKYIPLLEAVVPSLLGGPNP